MGSEDDEGVRVLHVTCPLCAPSSFVHSFLGTRNYYRENM